MKYHQKGTVFSLAILCGVSGFLLGKYSVEPAPIPQAMNGDKNFAKLEQISILETPATATSLAKDQGDDDRSAQEKTSEIGSEPKPPGFDHLPRMSQEAMDSLAQEQLHLADELAQSLRDNGIPQEDIQSMVNESTKMPNASPFPTLESSVDNTPRTTAEISQELRDDLSSSGVNTQDTDNIVAATKDLPVSTSEAIENMPHPTN